jgi:hypothetical protein
MGEEPDAPIVYLKKENCTTADGSSITRGRKRAEEELHRLLKDWPMP